MSFSQFDVNFRKEKAFQIQLSKLLTDKYNCTVPNLEFIQK